MTPVVTHICRIVVCLLLCAQVAARSLPDSVSVRYLSAIAMANTDTARIRRILEYSEALLKYDPDSALTLNTAAMKQSKDIDFREGLIVSLMQTAKIQQGKGLFEQADATLHEALMWCSGTEIKWRPRLYQAIAYGYTIQGAYRQAADYYYQTILAIEKTPDAAIRPARIYQNLSVVWFQLKDESKTLYYLDKAIAQARIDKDSVNLGNALNKKGNIYYLRQDTARAFYHYRQAYEISRTCKDLQTEAEAAGNLANIYLKQNQPEQARPYAERVWHLSSDPRLDIYHRLSLLYGYGVLLTTLKENAKAEKYLLQAVRQADSLHAALYKVKPLKALSELYASAGDYNNAYRYQQAYAGLNDSLVNEDKLKAVTLLEKKYRIAQKDKILALKQLEAAKQQAGLMKKNILIAIAGIGSGLLLVFFFVLRRNQKRKLKLQQEQIRNLEKTQELEQFKALMDGEGKERKRVARELHDGVGSMLSIAKLNLSVVRDRYDALRHTPDVMEVMDLLDQSSKAVRGTAHSLMPELLLRGGIEEALQRYCGDWQRESTVHIDFQSYGTAPAMAKEQEEMLFRVLQELLQHVIALAGINNLLFQLNWQETLLYVTLEANGHIFDVGKMKPEQAESWVYLEKRIIASNGILDVTHTGEANTTFDLEFGLQTTGLE